MFRRRRRLLASPRPVAPPGGFAEFHEFEGRWFVTDGWATGSGVAVERPATGEYLGSAVLSRIEAARGSRRPVVVSMQEQAGNQRRAAAEWERFCAGVAGVLVRRYRPEKRLVILADQTGMRCDDARNSPPGWQRLPDGRPEAVGAALIAWMERLEPSWPTAASATVAYNGATVNRSFRQARGDSPGGGCPGYVGVAAAGQAGGDDVIAAAGPGWVAAGGRVGSAWTVPGQPAGCERAGRRWASGEAAAWLPPGRRP
jgi:hypothetical protein